MLEGGSELAMDLHPIQGVGVITWSFHSKETGIGTGWVGHLARAQTSPKVFVTWRKWKFLRHYFLWPVTLICFFLCRRIFLQEFMFGWTCLIGDWIYKYNHLDEIWIKWQVYVASVRSAVLFKQKTKVYHLSWMTHNSGGKNRPVPTLPPSTANWNLNHSHAFLLKVQFNT